MKYSVRRNKVALRLLALKYLPPEVARRPKAGFGIPLSEWLGQEGRKEIQGVLGSQSARIRDLMRPNYVDALLDDFTCQEWDRSRSSEYNIYQRVYCLWALERWLVKWKPAF